MNTREAFEAWHLKRFGRMPMRSEHVNAYANSVDHEMWESWQACVAWAARECERIVAHVPLKSTGKDDDWHFSDTAKAISLEAMTDIRAKFSEAFK